MTNEELDWAIGREALRICEERPSGLKFGELARTAARLAREGWTPPERPVDPDLLAVRRLLAEEYPRLAKEMLAGERDHITHNQRFLAGYKAGKATR
jgi:hypothetical protein